MNNISAALVAAQAEMPAIPMDETNPFLKNKFASLGSVIRTAYPVLAKHKLAVCQMVTSDDLGRIGVETRIVHESGEYLTSTVYLPITDEKGKSDAQVAGSIISYLRRYSLAAMLGMYADEDVGGNAPKPAQPKQVAIDPADKFDAAQIEFEDSIAKRNPEPHVEKMGLATAMAVKSSDGTAYGEIPTDKLGLMHNQIVKQLKLTDLPSEKREEYEFKRDAIATILANRK